MLSEANRFRAAQLSVGQSAFVDIITFGLTDASWLNYFFCEERESVQYGIILFYVILVGWW